MRITTRLRVISAVTIAAFVVLTPVLVWSLIEFKNAKSNYVLSDTIQDNASERTSFRDQYFLYREDRARMQWDANKETADSLLSQANAQFHGEENQQALERLRRNIEDSTIIFHRIVSNTEALRAADNNRYVYEELDKRLASQLLLKAATIRDIASALQSASTRRVEQAYQYLTITVGLFALTLALAIILASVQLDRLIRKRLELLHDGARIVAGGDLDYRIQCGGADEFTELALSINAMTESLQVSTKQLEAEINAHKSVEIALRDSEERLHMVLTGAEMATWDWHIPSGALVFNARWAEMQGYTLE
ncbi:MAG: HAMP domain-containing protein [Burkholderiaceae bacterium]